TDLSGWSESIRTGHGADRRTDALESLGNIRYRHIQQKDEALTVRADVFPPRGTVSIRHLQGTRQPKKKPGLSHLNGGSRDEFHDHHFPVWSHVVEFLTVPPPGDHTQSTFPGNLNGFRHRSATIGLTGVEWGERW